MLHTEFASFRLMTWVYESPDKKQKYAYEIRTNGDMISKEDLVKIAETYLK